MTCGLRETVLKQIDCLDDKETRNRLRLTAPDALTPHLKVTDTLPSNLGCFVFAVHPFLPFKLLSGQQFELDPLRLLQSTCFVQHLLFEWDAKRLAKSFGQTVLKHDGLRSFGAKRLLNGCGNSYDSGNSQFDTKTEWSAANLVVMKGLCRGAETSPG